MVRTAGLFADHAMARLASCGARRRGIPRLDPGFWCLHAGRYGDWLGKLVVDRLDVVIAVPIMEGANDRRMCAANDFDDAAFGATVSAFGPKFHQHLVAAHGGVHVSR